MISNTDATDIARRHGLSLSDAAALARLADSRDEAEQIAERFKAAPADPEPLSREAADNIAEHTLRRF